MSTSPKIHTLANGATLIVVSPGHSFKFSDGTECGPQEKEVCDKLTLKRESRLVRTIRGMALNETRFVLDDEQLGYLNCLCGMADLVMVPFPVLAALREAGQEYNEKYGPYPVRGQFPNVVAMNATPETQRSAPADKVVDVDNWSY